MASLYVKDKQRLRGIRYMLLAIAVLNGVLNLILNIISGFFETPLSVYINALIIGIIAYIVPIYIYAKTNSVTAKTAAERFRLKRCEPSILIFSALLGVSWQFVMIVINLPINLIIGVSEPYVFDGIWELLVSIAVIAVIPSFFEEFLFRGIVDGSMEEMNTEAATIFSSVMFAILHGDMYGFLGYLIMGVVLSVIARRTDCIYAAMVFHLANNTTALLLGYFNSELNYAPALTIGLFVGGIICFAALFILFVKATKVTKRETKIRTTHLLGQSFVNIPILICIAVVILTRIIAEML